MSQRNGALGVVQVVNKPVADAETSLVDRFQCALQPVPHNREVWAVANETDLKVHMPIMRLRRPRCDDGALGRRLGTQLLSTIQMRRVGIAPRCRSIAPRTASAFSISA